MIMPLANHTKIWANVDADYLPPCGGESDFGILSPSLKCQKSQERGFVTPAPPSLGFSKDLAKRLNPGKSFLSHKGRDNRHRLFSLKRDEYYPANEERNP